MSGIGVTRVAEGIRAALDASGCFPVAYAMPTADPEVPCAMVLPRGGSMENQCVANLRFAVELLAPVSDMAASIAWLEDSVAAVRDALAADPTCQGTCSGIAVESWEGLYITSIGSGNAVGLRVSLTETNPTEEP